MQLAQLDAARERLQLQNTQLEAGLKDVDTHQQLELQRTQYEQVCGVVGLWGGGRGWWCGGVVVVWGSGRVGWWARCGRGACSLSCSARSTSAAAGASV